MIKNTSWSLCQISMKLELFGQIFRKNAQILNFMKICPVEAEFFHADGGRRRRDMVHTDTMKLIVAFRNFANASKR